MDSHEESSVDCSIQNENKKIDIFATDNQFSKINDFNIFTETYSYLCNTKRYVSNIKPTGLATDGATSKWDISAS